MRRFMRGANSAVEQERVSVRSRTQHAKSLSKIKNVRFGRSTNGSGTGSSREASCKFVRKTWPAGLAWREKNKELVSLVRRKEASRQEADARAYGVAAVMKALEGVDAKVLQSLASVNMEPAQLVASGTLSRSGWRRGKNWRIEYFAGTAARTVAKKDCQIRCYGPAH